MRALDRSTKIVRALCIGAPLLVPLGTQHAYGQAFFANLVTDPVVGVDRGSVSVIRRVDKPLRFLTVDSYGAEDVGPYIGGFGAAIPNAILLGDQFDIIGVLAGPSDTGKRELLAGGLGYRLDLGGSNNSIYFNGDYRDIRLGSPQNLQLDAKGSNANFTIGFSRRWELAKQEKITGTIAFAARGSHGEVLGTSVIDEDLRIIRASLIYENGYPLLFQQRLAGAITKGIDGLGASPANNSKASSPGATSDFLRASFSAEASIPLSKSFVVNAGVIGQWTNDSLPVSQRCGYGTNAYMRGFDLSYVNGDRCAGARVELAYNVTLPDPKAARLSFTQAYMGVDLGIIEDVSNAFLPTMRDNWSSASIGVRTLQGDFIGEISLSQILDQPTGIVEQDKTRLWFRSAVKF